MEIVDEAIGPVARGSWRWLALVAMLLAAAMDLIDTTIVNVAIPSIRGDLGAGSAAAEWIVSGYALAFGIMLITGGRLGDAFGRRRLFLVGVAAFMVASLMCGLAPTVGVLIAGRVAQGVAAALMVPQILTVIQVNFTSAERPRAYAAYGACAAIATVSGPLVGGVLIRADLFDLEWRPIFLVNVVLGLAVLLATAAWLPESRAPQVQRFDLVGVGLLAMALLLLLYPLVEAPQRGWSAWSFVLVGGAVAVFVLFAAQQRRGRWPLVTPSLFGRRGFTAGVAAQLTLYAGVTGFFLVLALTLQSGFGFSALHTGLTFLPFSIGIALSSGVSGQLAARLGRRLTMTGVLVMAVGMAGLRLAISITSTHPNTWTLAPGLIIAGLGMGLVAPTLVGVALTGVPSRDAGSASGVVTTTGQLGAAIGVAAIGAIFFGALPRHPPRHPGPATGTASNYSAAFTAALYYEIGIFLFAALLMLLLPKAAPARGRRRGRRPAARR